MRSSSIGVRQCHDVVIAAVERWRLAPLRGAGLPPSEVVDVVIAAVERWRLAPLRGAGLLPSMWRLLPPLSLARFREQPQAASL